MQLDIPKWRVEEYHRMAKDKLYSADTIADYWVLDVKNR